MDVFYSFFKTSNLSTSRLVVCKTRLYLFKLNQISRLSFVIDVENTDYEDDNEEEVKAGRRNYYLFYCEKQPTVMIPKCCNENEIMNLR